MLGHDAVPTFRTATSGFDRAQRETSLGMAYHTSPLDPEERAMLAREVRERNLAAVARELKVPRSSLSSVIVGTAREGTERVVADRVRQRTGKAEP